MAVPGPAGLVAVTVSTGPDEELTGLRAIPGRFGHYRRIMVVTARGNQLYRQQRQGQAPKKPQNYALHKQNLHAV